MYITFQKTKIYYKIKVADYDGTKENEPLGDITVDLSNYDFTCGKPLKLTNAYLENVPHGRINLEISYKPIQDKLVPTKRMTSYNRNPEPSPEPRASMLEPGTNTPKSASPNLPDRQEHSGSKHNEKKNSMIKANVLPSQLLSNHSEGRDSGGGIGIGFGTIEEEHDDDDDSLDSSSAHSKPTMLKKGKNRSLVKISNKVKTMVKVAKNINKSVLSSNHNNSVLPEVMPKPSFLGGGHLDNTNRPKTTDHKTTTTTNRTTTMNSSSRPNSSNPYSRDNSPVAAEYNIPESPIRRGISPFHRRSDTDMSLSKDFFGSLKLTPSLPKLIQSDDLLKAENESIDIIQKSMEFSSMLAKKALSKVIHDGIIFYFNFEFSKLQ